MFYGKTKQSVVADFEFLMEWLLQEIRVSATKLLPANPAFLEGVDDLIKLSYLNEPSVLHDLDYRYSKDQIYVSASF